MAEIHDPENILTMEFFRQSGEGEEISVELAGQAGFAIPVFFSTGLYKKLGPDSVTSSYGISRQQNILDTLHLLRRISEGSEKQTIVFDTAIPAWDPRTVGFEARDIKLAASLFIAKDSPFIIICEYDEIKDIEEGRLSPPPG